MTGKNQTLPVAGTSKTNDVDSSLLAILRCPKTGQRLRRLTPDEVTQLNGLLVVQNAASTGQSSPQALFSDGVVTDDGQFAYPLEHGLPILITDRAVQYSKETPS